MEHIELDPKNVPDGSTGAALLRTAAVYDTALDCYVQAGDAAVLAGAERGELVEPNPHISDAIAYYGGILNDVGAMFVADQVAYREGQEREVEAKVQSMGRVGRWLGPVLRFFMWPSDWRK